MSITIVTGVPGSGKTLYAVSKLLPEIIGTHVDRVLDNGTVEKIPRIVYTNINGLRLDHELVEAGGDWIGSGKAWSFSGNELGVRCWHKWAKPGALICFDEFQRAWPPRPNGSAVPPDISALDTHRHMGVDFILICQNLMNVDRHILGLCDRHLHVRRIANFASAIVYEWDHASKSLTYKNSFAKSAWRYSKAAFAQYKSAEVHTKQKRKIPTLMIFVAFGILGSLFMWPYFMGRISDRVAGVPGQVASVTGVKPPGLVPAAGAPAVPASGPVVEIRDGMRVTTTTTTFPPAAASAPVAAASEPQFLGCVASASKCSCVAPGGKLVAMALDHCADRPGVASKPLAVLPDSVKSMAVPVAQADFDFSEVRPLVERKPAPLWYVR